MSNRHPLQGTVRVDGVAIENGSISFLPLRDTPGTPATTLIVNGEYQFTSESGPCSGRHRVVVGADPKQTFAASSKMSLPAGNEQSIADGRGGSARSVKLAPAHREEAARPDLGRSVDPGRNQWELEFEVPSELTLRKDFDFVTPPTGH